MHIGVRAGSVLALGIALGGTIACGSGDGQPSSPSPPGPTGGYEPPPGTYESAGSTYDNPGHSYEQGGVAGGGLPLSPCTGTYTCDAFAAALSNSGGVCTLTVTQAGSGGMVVFAPDGTVTSSGQEIGTWSGSSASFTIFITSQDGGLATAVSCTAG